MTIFVLSQFHLGMTAEKLEGKLKFTSTLGLNKEKGFGKCRSSFKYDAKDKDEQDYIPGNHFLPSLLNLVQKFNLLALF